MMPFKIEPKKAGSSNALNSFEHFNSIDQSSDGPSPCTSWGRSQASPQSFGMAGFKKTKKNSIKSSFSQQFKRAQLERMREQKDSEGALASPFQNELD